jgi:hypothetical protein
MAATRTITFMGTRLIEFQFCESGHQFARVYDASTIIVNSSATPCC